MSVLVMERVAPERSLLANVAWGAGTGLVGGLLFPAPKPVPARETALATPDAFTLARERVTPLGATFRGVAGFIEIEFPAIPGLVPVIDRVIRSSADISNEVREKLLGWTIEQDPEPFFDRYRVTVAVSEAVDREDSGRFPAAVRPTPSFAVTALVTVAIALSIALLGAAVSWRVFNGDWGPFSELGIALPIAAAAVAVVVVLIATRQGGIRG